MSLAIGIVGLPNVGKSTTFNALTQTQNAQVANYPFCTIQPNRAVVPVPDPRLDRLQELVGVPERIPATIQFLDIAGLVRGASRGEGLGNQFLGQIRNVDAILHVVRCFEDPNVVHVSEVLDPNDDIETIQTELALADLEQIERKIERLESSVKGDKKLRPLLDTALAMRAHLAEGRPLSEFEDRESETFQGLERERFLELEREMRFLTAKPVIYAANVDEAGLTGENACVEAVQAVAGRQGAQVIRLCAQLEMEMAGMDPKERQEFLELAGAEQGGLEQLIRTGYETLGLISFFTKNENEVRAWTVQKGATAPQAAGQIHTDFERGFIRAEVVPFRVFAGYGSDAAVRAAGAMQLEGKEYVVQDGDVIYFRFHV